MRRKIIDDYCLYYLNDLFGIKLINLLSELNVAFFFSLYGLCVLLYETFLTIFSLKTQQIEVRLLTLKSAFLSH